MSKDYPDVVDSFMEGAHPFLPPKERHFKLHHTVVQYAACQYSLLAQLGLYSSVLLGVWRNCHHIVALFAIVHLLL